MTGLEKYHAHLDACDKCRNNPFGQCPMGDLLLRLAVADVTKDLPALP